MKLDLTRALSGSTKQQSLELHQMQGMGSDLTYLSLDRTSDRRTSARPVADNYCKRIDYVGGGKSH